MVIEILPFSLPHKQTYDCAIAVMVTNILTYCINCFVIFIKLIYQKNITAPKNILKF